MSHFWKSLKAPTLVSIDVKHLIHTVIYCLTANMHTHSSTKAFTIFCTLQPTFWRQRQCWFNQQQGWTPYLHYNVLLVSSCAFLTHMKAFADSSSRTTEMNVHTYDTAWSTAAHVKYLGWLSFLTSITSGSSVVTHHSCATLAISSYSRRRPQKSYAVCDSTVVPKWSTSISEEF